MKIIYDAEKLKNELNTSIGNKKLSKWYWVFYLHENTQDVAIRAAMEFIFENRRRLNCLYTDNDKLAQAVKERLFDCLLQDGCIHYSPCMKSKKIHAKLYFFGDKDKIAKCNNWVAFIGSYNIQFEEQKQGGVKIAAPLYFESMAKLTSDEDSDVLNDLAEYFENLKREINASRRKMNRVRILPEREDYSNYINKHESDVIEYFKSRKHSQMWLRNWEIFKEKCKSEKGVFNEELGRKYGLKRERIGQIIKKVKKELPKDPFAFLESEV